jgi:type II secretory pathway component PulK
VHRRPRTSARRGFALLITITLLAFLVLLLVSLASLTRVETQVAANNTQLTQARANALFALNLAVGQLQKYAGQTRR